MAPLLFSFFLALGYGASYPGRTNAAGLLPVPPFEEISDLKEMLSFLCPPRRFCRINGPSAHCQEASKPRESSHCTAHGPLTTTHQPIPTDAGSLAL